MGIHQLWKIIQPFGIPDSIISFHKKILVIDVSIWFHQLTLSKNVPNSNQSVGKHIIRRLIRLISFNIYPILIFEGPPSILKQNTLLKRAMIEKARKHAIHNEKMTMISEYSVKQMAEKLLNNRLNLAKEKKDMKEETLSKIELEDREDDREDFITSPSTLGSPKLFGSPTILNPRFAWKNGIEIEEKLTEVRELSRLPLALNNPVEISKAQITNILLVNEKRAEIERLRNQCIVNEDEICGALKRDGFDDYKDCFNVSLKQEPILTDFCGEKRDNFDGINKESLHSFDTIKIDKDEQFNDSDSLNDLFEDEDTEDEKEPEEEEKGIENSEEPINPKTRENLIFADNVVEKIQHSDGDIIFSDDELQMSEDEIDRDFTDNSFDDDEAFDEISYTENTSMQISSLSFKNSDVGSLKKNSILKNHSFVSTEHVEVEEEDQTKNNPEHLSFNDFDNETRSKLLQIVNNSVTEESILRKLKDNDMLEQDRFSTISNNLDRVVLGRPTALLKYATLTDMDLVMEFANSVSIPVIKSRNEADAQCCFTSKGSVLTTDSDLILYSLLFDKTQNIFKMNGFSDAGYSYSRRDLIDNGIDVSVIAFLALLLGCDYCDGIKQVGPVLALEMACEFFETRTDDPKHDLWIALNKISAILKDNFNFEENKKKMTRVEKKVWKKRENFPKNWPNENVIRHLLTPNVHEVDLSVFEKTIDDNTLSKKTAAFLPAFIKDLNDMEFFKNSWSQLITNMNNNDRLLMKYQQNKQLKENHCKNRILKWESKQMTEFFFLLKNKRLNF
eukprot:TRINITY_DN14177_c0_g1_i1.p1 TRINITY_DN14177_c0_g1~~TRINITY_DN14177_c0_g1_i1.p1  ORF type:complete len:789 (+),score=239.28 TRINITY_DN14177_c0_g1_i1:65-2431(+)